MYKGFLNRLLFIVNSWYYIINKTFIAVNSGIKYIDLNYINLRLYTNIYTKEDLLKYFWSKYLVYFN